jgi:hypothetical protein
MIISSSILGSSRGRNLFYFKIPLFAADIFFNSSNL